jgi:uncharacterized protein (DUF1330 family)
MAAHVIGLIRLKDEVAWREYVSQVGATIAQYGGEVLFRGITDSVFAGNHPHDLSVALRFADIVAAKRWLDSPEYQRIVPIRDKGADVTLTVYES